MFKQVLQIYIHKFFDKMHIFRYNFQKYYSRSKMLFFSQNIRDIEKRDNGKLFAQIDFPNLHSQIFQIICHES